MIQQPPIDAEQSIRALETRVLVLAPAGVDGLLIGRELTFAGIGVRVCESLGELCGRIQHGIGAAVVSEEALTPSAIASFAKTLASQPPWSDLPIVVLTGGGASDRRSERAARGRDVLGNVSLLERPIRPITLISAVRSALRARARQYEIRDHLNTLTQVTQALSQSEQRYRSLVSASSSLVWLADAEGGARSFQPAWESFTGQAPYQYAGSGWLDAIHPADRNDVLRSWSRAIETRAGTELQFRIRRANGSYRLIQWRVVPVLDVTGNLLEWVATCTDIQDQAALQLALQNAEKFAIAGKLAGTIAHDINNPLEGVTNLVYLIGSTSEEQTVREYAHAAQHELSRIGDITRQTLTFYRYSTERELLDLRAIVEAVVNLLANQLSGKRISVTLKFGELRPVRCFASEIRQVVANIVTNAIDAMPSGGRLIVRANLRTNWKNGGKKGLHITIADTGHGIGRDVRQRVFEPFFSTRQERGNGLGLWITAEFIRKNHGRFALKSSTRPGHSGTVFSIFFPCE
ncbi:MAG TPA: ATP-binding protein [Terriglobales bacterium]|nr:ATP-binding protein [Terriglobales bacterium]